jgi:ribosome-binding protein aMBF1 (putative translation factor)
MSFQITITPKERASGRFVSKVRRAIQKALAEETKKRGITQSDLARTIGINRSVISREIRGHKDMTLGRVGELAWALGRKPTFDLLEMTQREGSNSTPMTKVAGAGKTFPIGNSANPISSATDASSKVVLVDS